MQRVDWLQVRRFCCGIAAEQYADDRAEGDSGKAYSPVHIYVCRRDQFVEFYRSEGDHQTDHAADYREDTRLTEELCHNVPSLGADRLADADLARSLADGDKHDVHNTDTADQQRDRRDARQKQRHGVFDLGHRVEYVGLVPYLESVLVTRKL